MFTYEREGDAAHFFSGGSAKAPTHPGTAKRPDGHLVLDIHVDIYVESGTILSDARDIRAEHVDTPLYDLRCTPREFYRAKREDNTWNTQLDPVHLFALQKGIGWAAAADLTVVSIDIEVIAEDGSFPDAERDPILQIAICGESNHVLSLGDSAYDEHGVDFDHECFTTEADLLTRFCAIVRELDPDYITGWNVLNFDFAYIADRARILELPLPLGRNGAHPRRWDKETHTRAHGTRVTKNDRHLGPHRLRRDGDLPKNPQRALLQVAVDGDQISRRGQGRHALL